MNRKFVLRASLVVLVLALGTTVVLLVLRDRRGSCLMEISTSRTYFSLPGSTEPDFEEVQIILHPDNATLVTGPEPSGSGSAADWLRETWPDTRLADVRSTTTGRLGDSRYWELVLDVEGASAPGTRGLLIAAQRDDGPILGTVLLMSGPTVASTAVLIRSTRWIERILTGVPDYRHVEFIVEPAQSTGG